MLVKLLKRKPLTWFYVAGLVLIVVTIGVWCYSLRINAERVFWGMVEDSLSTSAVTVQSSQDMQGSKIDQTIQYSFGPQTLTRSFTTLNREGTKVVDEMIGTVTADYTRYVSIKTDQKKADGGELDFSKVLGIWAKSDADASTGAQGQLVSQAVLGTGLPLGGLAVPIGSLSPELRGKLLQQMRNDQVYAIDYAKVKKERKDGRLLYTYDATVKPVAYASMMKSFAQSVGLRSLDQLDPSTFAGRQPMTLQLTVDVHARQLVGITAEDGAVSQAYKSHGVPVHITPPTESITFAELQKRLQELQ